MLYVDPFDVDPFSYEEPIKFSKTHWFDDVYFQAILLEFYWHITTCHWQRHVRQLAYQICLPRIRHSVHITTDLVKRPYNDNKTFFRLVLKRNEKVMVYRSELLWHRCGFNCKNHFFVKICTERRIGVNPYGGEANLSVLTTTQSVFTFDYKLRKDCTVGGGNKDTEVVVCKDTIIFCFPKMVAYKEKQILTLLCY